MNNRIRLAGSLVAAVAALVVTPPAFADSYSEANCVSGGEWHSIQDDRFGTVSHSARRSVFEKAWDVEPVGPRNSHFKAENDNYYSLAYRFCGSADVVVVIVYRDTSDAWQFALKGAFVPTPEGVD